jgi:site-specific DNA-methyltransferase (adenine-specific)
MMKPYYDDGQITIYHGDARDILPTLHADLIVADPPYEQTSLEWDIWPYGWPSMALMALSQQGSLWCFGSMRMFLEKRDEFTGWSFGQDIVWEKHNGSNFHNDRFRRVHESIVQFYPTSTMWNQVYHSPVFTMDATKRTARRKGKPPHMGNIGEGSLYESEDGGPRLMRSAQFVKSTHGYAIHPTQKPVGIIVPLLKYSCPQDGVVIDLFAGGFSTSVAAKDLGMRVIAIEVDVKRIEAGIDRLNTPIERQIMDARSDRERTL